MPDITDAIGITRPNDKNNYPKILPEITVKNNDFSLDIITETRAEINKYLFDIEKIKTMLPYLNIDENFGRPKHYIKK